MGLSLLGMSCEGLIGRAMSAEHKGTASSWFQAGNFLGLGVGGGAAIELVARMGGGAGGAILAAVLLVCAFPLLLFDDARDLTRLPLAAALAALGRDLRELVRSSEGLTAIVLCVSPVGSGAASNLFGAMADQWHASRDLVAVTTGALGGVVSAAGAASGMLVINRMRRRSAYVLGGLLTAVTGALMAVAPYTPVAYASFTLAYQFFNGFSFAAFSALAFETVGRGAVVTKYNILASLVNLSIVYATRIDARAHARFGGAGVLLTDASLTGVAIAVCAAAMAIAGRRTRAAP
jgi:hypothetical protein